MSSGDIDKYGAENAADSTASISFGVSFPAHMDKMEDDKSFEHRIVNLTINEPVILPAAEKGNNIKNVFAIPHDGFRSEVILVYKTLQMMKRQKFSVDSKVLKDFFLWWNRFEEALCDYFKLEEQVLFAQIENYTRLGGQLSPKLRQQTKMEIVFLSQSVGRCEGQFATRVTVEAVRELIGNIDKWVQKFLNYMAAKDELATQALRQACAMAPNLLADIESKLAKQIREVASGHVLQILMIKQMSPEEVKAWKKRNTSKIWFNKFYRDSTREYRRFRKLLLASQ